MVKSQKILYSKLVRPDGQIATISKISLAKKELEKYGITEEDPQVQVEYDADKIIITKQK
jgi:hypothetical protein